MNISELHVILVYISLLWQYSDYDLQTQPEKERKGEKLIHQNCVPPVPEMQAPLCKGGVWLVPQQNFKNPGRKASLPLSVLN